MTVAQNPCASRLRPIRFSFILWILWNKSSALTYSTQLLGRLYNIVMFYTKNIIHFLFLADRHVTIYNNRSLEASQYNENSHRGVLLLRLGAMVLWAQSFCKNLVCIIVGNGPLSLCVYVYKTFLKPKLKKS